MSWLVAVPSARRICWTICVRCKSCRKPVWLRRLARGTVVAEGAVAAEVEPRIRVHEYDAEAPVEVEDAIARPQEWC